MRFKSKFNSAINATLLISMFFFLFLMIAIIVNRLEVWLLTSLFLIFYICPLIILKDTVTINEEEILLENKSKNKEFYAWDEIKYFYDSRINKIDVIKITLKSGNEIYIEKRKVIKEEMKKYCGNIPDFSELYKKENIERYNNYNDKFIDLSECEFESITSNTEHCIFCNVKTNKVDEKCYFAMKNNRKFYICPKCFNDFKKYFFFKIKE